MAAKAIATVAPKSNRGSKPGERRGGRAKGTPNKVTAEVKDMVAAALRNKGGVKYLEKQADENPTAFLTLVGKIIPLQLNADHSVNVVDRTAAAQETADIFGPPRLVASNG